MKKIITLLSMIGSLNYVHGQWYPPLVFNFDTIESVFIDTTLTNNIWQIGKPQKFFFDSAFTIPNAIVTDTINVYPTNNISEFVVKTPTYMGPMGGVGMSFNHKFDTDTLVDGGTILVSLDGITWVNLINSPSLTFTNNLYSASSPVSSLSSNGISGRSNGWLYATCYWNYPPTDTLWVKFKFASDNNQTNKEGWMIDGLRFDYDLGIGMNELSATKNCSLFPNPVQLQATLTFASSVSPATLSLFNSQGQIVRSIDNIVNGRVIINSEGLLSGLYYFKVLSNEGMLANGKFVVE